MTSLKERADQNPRQENLTQTQEMPERRLTPLADAILFEDHLKIVIDLPGVRLDQVQVTEDDEQLRVSAKREESQRGQLLHREFGATRFERSFTLPEGFDASAITADLTDGVLTLNLPRAEAPLPRSIKIESR